MPVSRRVSPVIIGNISPAIITDVSPAIVGNVSPAIVWNTERNVNHFMMLYPAMSELNAQIHNRYMLVNVVARRARCIAEAYENAHQILNEKPVTIAINEVANGLLEDPERTAPETEELSAETDTQAPATPESEHAEPEAETEQS